MSVSPEQTHSPGALSGQPGHDRVHPHTRCTHTCSLPTCTLHDPSSLKEPCPLGLHTLPQNDSSRVGPAEASSLCDHHSSAKSSRKPRPLHTPAHLAHSWPPALCLLCMKSLTHRSRVAGHSLPSLPCRTRGARDGHHVCWNLVPVLEGSRCWRVGPCQPPWRSG